MSNENAVSPGRGKRLGAMILVAAIYAVVGILSGAFAREATSNQMRVAWRLAAFMVSGIAFASHIIYEHFRLRTSPAMTAWPTSLAVALGAFAGVSS